MRMTESWTWSRRWLGALVLVLLAGGCTAPGSSQLNDQGQGGGNDDTPQAEQAIPGLERIPWEGGPEYWAQFDHAREAGWTSPDFFPIVSWFNGISSEEEVRYDQSLGLNTYIGQSDTTPYRLFSDNDVYYIGPKLNDSFTEASVNWVGQLLGDEVDGQFGDPVAGLEHLREQSATVPQDLFRYTNFTQLVIGDDMNPSDAENYVNGPLDVASMDMYWYSVPFCSKEHYRDIYLVPVNREHCRSASSYGKATKALWLRDGADSQRQPVWQFVENYNGGPGGQPLVAAITPRQVEAAVMSSLINEARGILYFNQSLSGDCLSGNVFRDTQMNPEFCAAENVAAVGRINGKIHDLARVLNTQSYAHHFGPGLQTMLKASNGHAYIFAMADGDSAPGERRLTLPDGITGRVIEVLYEDRTLEADDDRTFSDRFDDETTYHIYKVKL